MRTCRLVCKRWAAVIGESVAAVGVSAELLRSTVLSDEAPAASKTGAAGARQERVSSEEEEEEEEEEGDGDAASTTGRAPEAEQSGGGGATTGYSADPSVGGGRPRPATVAAMRRLRRLSRQLARAFPRAHTCVIHIDVG
jgi:hypothetical protein